MKTRFLLYLPFLLVSILSCNLLQAQTTPSPTQTLQLENQQGSLKPSVTPSPTPSPSQTPVPAPKNTPTQPNPTNQLQPVADLPTETIQYLWIDPEGHLWMASQDGTFVYQDGDWLHLYREPVDLLLGADSDGRIWALLEGERAIAAYDLTGAWRVYGPDQGWTALSPVEYPSPGVGDGLATDSQGRIWLATGRDELRQFDPSTDTWYVFSASEIGFAPPEESGYQGHFLTDVAVSGDQKVWVSDCIGVGESLKGQGMRWNDSEGWIEVPSMEDQCVLDLEVDDAGRVWAGGFDALNLYDPATDSWSRLPLPAWERRQLVWDITLNPEGKPWVEVLQYGGASPFGQVARYHLQDDGEWVLDYEGWFSNIVFDDYGTAWLCSEGVVYRLVDGQLKEIGEISGASCQIAVDGTGRVWVASATALWWLDP